MESGRRGGGHPGVTGIVVACILAASGAASGLEGAIEEREGYIPLSRLLPESLPVGTPVLTEGYYRGRINGAVALRDCPTIFLVDGESAVGVEFSDLTPEDVVRVEGVTAYSSDTRTYYILVKKIGKGVSPREKVMAVLKAPDVNAAQLMETGKWARQQASQYNDDILDKLANAAFVKAIRAEELRTKPTDYEGYFKLAEKAREFVGEPGFRETYVRTGIDAYILASGRETAQVYYEAAKKAEELLPGSTLPDLLIERGWTLECGGTAPGSAGDYLDLAGRARSMFGEGLHYHRLLGKALDIEYRAVKASDYTALYALARKAREIYPDYPNYREIVTKGISEEKAAMDPRDAEAWVRLGNRILYFLEDKHQAGVAWRHAVSCDPANQEVRAKLRDLGFVFYRGSWWWADEFSKSELFKRVQEWEELVAAHEVAVGMSQDQVIRAKGMPAETHMSGGGWGVTTQWIYREGDKSTYLAFIAETLVSKGEVKSEGY